MYCDNSTTVFFSKNDKYSKGAKHMELKYSAMKKEVQKQRVSIETINTNLMIVDLLTKGLPPKIFIEHVENMIIIVIKDFFWCNVYFCFGLLTFWAHLWYVSDYLFSTLVCVFVLE